MINLTKKLVVKLSIPLNPRVTWYSPRDMSDAEDGVEKYGVSRVQVL